MKGLLERLALHRPELRAWAMYDWANSAFVTIVVSAVFPIYFSTVAGADLEPAVATSRFTITTTIALAVVAFAAPVLGALADYAPIKKKMLSAFLLLGAGSTGAMWFIEEGGWLYAAVVFALANIGAMSSFVFYDSLLPHVASDEEMDRVSTAGYALGYIGGAILLAASLAMIQEPIPWGLPDGETATRVAFVSVAVWWLVFSIPLLKRVPEPAVRLVDERLRGAHLVRRSFSGLASTFRSLRTYRQALVFLFAFLIYNDGIGTIIKLATIYGAEIGLETAAMIKAIILVQIVGIPFTFVFGQVAGKLGSKRSIYAGLLVYCGVSTLGYFMKTETHFYLLATLVGMVQGGVQALSRSLFASMIPRAKSSEFFGLFAVFEKFAGILGPALFAGMIAATGSSRNAILSIISFFVAGGLLLTRVDVTEGQRIAREANHQIE